MDTNWIDTDAILETLNERFTAAELAEFEKLLDPGDQNNWKTDVIVSLARRCFSLEGHLRRAFAECDEHYIAWAARTLLEIRLFSEYVALSEEKMLRFSQDHLVDANHALNVTSKVLAKVSNEDTVRIGTEFIGNAAPVLKEHTDAAGASEFKRFLEMSEIATMTGNEVEFKMSNTLLSKFTHATGVSSAAQGRGSGRFC